MTIKLSQRVQSIKPSPTLAITARAAALRAEGKDIIGLGAGEPDFDTPDHIKQAAVKALDKGQTKYTAVDGTAELKNAIIKKFSRDNGLTYEANQILVSCGGKQSFFNLAQALLESGDEVIIPAPYWVSYPDMVLLADAKPVIIIGDRDQRYKITPQQLEEAITDKTRLFVINSPSNPTGMTYTKAELEALGEVLRKYPDILIATDDMYELIYWADEPFYNIVMACPDLYDRTIVMNGVSKAYSMTGWRIGYAGGPAQLIGAMKKIQSQSTSNPTSISQAASVEALNGDQGCVQTMLVEFKKRHDFVVEKLNQMQGITALETDGTFYVFPDISGVLANKPDLTDDMDFAEALLVEKGVAVVPGTAFGLKNHIRLSIATSESNLQNALQRIAEFIEQ
ncbi:MULTISPECIES: pyridoxal phosphate-dependent aminotransferase [unclassified Methylophaga]|uniref:pyridoxal phosphate-dependent aminotransferase n=1 Tax=unclassified Methylophaga TaxID=2629249 RepID=UPI000C55EDBB|nr:MULTISPECIES: pyridoxal phosphate-dependent aminotransferase [unclassified Methylophaga]MAL49687.1 aspartate aminotransferase [Methylophaga sp.]MAP27734.1 aspartate aminotransferase [Methylophaga sp.]MBP24121.1 aspartate aminotransferase [Methylophaga sp.]HBX59317.1 aspartate transaminase [Methylophaga sp.]